MCGCLYTYRVFISYSVYTGFHIMPGDYKVRKYGKEIEYEYESAEVMIGNDIVHYARVKMLKLFFIILLNHFITITSIKHM